MDTVDPARFIFAFTFVIGLICLMALFMRHSGRGKQLFGKSVFAAGGEGGRTQMIETRYLDARRRLLLIRRDDREHLLLLADGRELLIESFPAKDKE